MPCHCLFRYVERICPFKYCVCFIQTPFFTNNILRHQFLKSFTFEIAISINSVLMLENTDSTHEVKTICQMWSSMSCLCFLPPPIKIGKIQMSHVLAKSVMALWKRVNYLIKKSFQSTIRTAY